MKSALFILAFMVYLAQTDKLVDLDPPEIPCSGQIVPSKNACVQFGQLRSPCISYDKDCYQKILRDAVQSEKIIGFISKNLENSGYRSWDSSPAEGQGQGQGQQTPHADGRKEEVKEDKIKAKIDVEEKVKAGIESGVKTALHDLINNSTKEKTDTVTSSTATASPVVTISVPGITKTETIAILALTGILIILAVATFILCRYIVRNNPESCPAKTWKAIKKCCIFRINVTRVRPEIPQSA